MTATQPYQHQLLYQITPEDYAALRGHLSEAAPEASGTSCVHTLRFNSYRSLPDDPEKASFALYYFDNDPTYLLLERRLGEERTTAMVAEAECRALLAGETGWLLERRNPVLQDFYDSLTERMLLPQVMLTYHREVYTLDGLDLWVALDTDIRSSLQHMDFLDPELLARDTADQEGQLRLAISYSDGIPENMVHLLAKTSLAASRTQAQLRQMSDTAVQQ